MVYTIVKDRKSIYVKTPPIRASNFFIINLEQHFLQANIRHSISFSIINYNNFFLTSSYEHPKISASSSTFNYNNSSSRGRLAIHMIPHRQLYYNNSSSSCEHLAILAHRRIVNFTIIISCHYHANIWQY
jgi:hypothetical protein